MIRNGKFVVCQDWERNCEGKLHKDGYSLHLSEKDSADYVRLCLGCDGYDSVPKGVPYRVETDKKTFLKLLRANEPGIRFHDHSPG